MKLRNVQKKAVESAPDKMQRKHWTINLFKLLYPHRCPFCETVTCDDICTTCRKAIEEIHEPRCKKCGKPLDDDQKEYCYDCGRHQKAFEEGRSIWLHRKPVSDALYRFKYQNKRCYASFFAETLWEKYEKDIRRWNPDVIIPVPIHKKRRRRRGYNQAELIAYELGRCSNIPVDAGFVRRIVDTKPQKELGALERMENLRQAFMVCENVKNYKTVLLLDDIYTTGATIHTISRKMHRKGVEKVYFLTISIGQGF